MSRTSGSIFEHSVLRQSMKWDCGPRTKPRADAHDRRNCACYPDEVEVVRSLGQSRRDVGDMPGTEVCVCIHDKNPKLNAK